MRNAARRFLWKIIAAEERGRRMRAFIAAQLYRFGILSIVNARRVAGMERIEFMHLLGKLKIAPSYDIEELEKDVETLKEIGRL